MDGAGCAADVNGAEAPLEEGADELLDVGADDALDGDADEALGVVEEADEDADGALDGGVDGDVDGDGSMLNERIKSILINQAEGLC